MLTIENYEDILIMKISEKLTHEDYKEVLIPATEKELEKMDLKRLKLAIVIEEDFEGVTLKAIIDDIIYGFKHRKEFYKIGMTGKYAETKKKFEKLATSLIKGQMKVFDTEEEMFNWLK